MGGPHWNRNNLLEAELVLHITELGVVRDVENVKLKAEITHEEEGFGARWQFFKGRLKVVQVSLIGGRWYVYSRDHKQCLCLSFN